jgi:hypothetical protein
VEKKTTKVKKVEQPKDFSSTPIKGGFFDVKVDSPNISIDVPTRISLNT